MNTVKTNTSLLIIEDDPQLSSNMELILKMEGFQVMVAADGLSGLAMIRTKKPDLILCDILLPGLDGYFVFETIKNNPLLAKIPFLFVSALDEPPQVRKGMLIGADDYITKPFAAEDLVAAVATRLERFAAIRPPSPNKRGEGTSEQKARLRSITRREREILLLVATGLTSREIADTLCISKKTVDVHRSRLMKKLDAANAVALASWAKVAEQLDADD